MRIPTPRTHRSKISNLSGVAPPVLRPVPRLVGHCSKSEVGSSWNEEGRAKTDQKSPIWSRLCRVLPILFIVLPGIVTYAGQDGVVQTFKSAIATVDDAKDLNLNPVLPIDTVQVNTRYQGGPFETETRKNRIERFRCTECHNNKDVKIAKAAKIAHGKIVLDHGGEDKPLSCFTCHKEDERDYLTSEKGFKIDMDHSYRMCGQCHFRQKKDWVGGAHGKRISYWAGKRVVQNCTTCHDPHSPLFEKRWPKTYSPPFIR